MAIYDLGHVRFNPFLTDWVNVPTVMPWISWQKAPLPR